MGMALASGYKSRRRSEPPTWQLVRRDVDLVSMAAVRWAVVRGTKCNRLSEVFQPVTSRWLV